MSVSRSDFEYDKSDTSKLRVAFDDMKIDEQKGFGVGLATWGGSYLVYRKLFNKNYNVFGLASFVTGVLAYNLYTHRSRTYYNDIARKVNIKVSKKLNLAMNYPAPEYKEEQFEYK